MFLVQNPHRSDLRCKREHRFRHGLIRYLFYVASDVLDDLFGGFIDGATFPVFTSRPHNAPDAVTPPSRSSRRSGASVCTQFAARRNFEIMSVVTVKAGLPPA